MGAFISAHFLIFGQSIVATMQKFITIIALIFFAKAPLLAYQTPQAALDSIQALAQTDVGAAYKKIDSILGHTNIQKEDSSALKVLTRVLQISNETSQLDLSLRISSKYNQLLFNHHLIDRYLYFKTQLATALLFSGQNDSAFAVLNELTIESNNYYNKQEFSTRKYRRLVSNIYDLLGIYYAMQENVPKALFYFTKCDSIAVLMDDLMHQGSYAGKIGNLYQMIRDYPKAISHYEKSIAIAIQFDDVRTAMTTYDNLALAHERLEDYKSSLQALKEGRKYARLAKDSMGVATNLNLTAGCLINLNEFDKAIKTLKKEKAIVRKTPYTELLLSMYSNYEYLYGNMGQYDSMLFYARKMYEIASNENIIVEKRNALLLMAGAYSLLKDYENAYHSIKHYQRLKDSIDEENFSNETAKLQAQYQDAQQKQEIARLNNEAKLTQEKQKRKEQANTFLTTGIVLSTITIILLGLLYRSSQRKKVKIETQHAALEKADREKALLLKELHHRVKNNLQIVSSLLNLQSDATKDAEAQIAFRDGQNRIDAMAMIHKHLYATDDLTSIDISTYINQLVKSIAFSYGFRTNDIELNIAVSNIPLDVDVAIPIGLIINELVSNSFKHAFKNTPKPVLNLQMDIKKEYISILLHDNGDGLPADFDLNTPNSFGLELVQTLVNQLKGHFNHGNNDGAFFEIQISTEKSMAA
ncbi:tetratricopeptide repeat protein [bacterium]|nr:tetratricopeptide repeat protein [bacterium]